MPQLVQVSLYASPTRLLWLFHRFWSCGKVWYLYGCSQCVRYTYHAPELPSNYLAIQPQRQQKSKLLSIKLPEMNQNWGGRCSFRALCTGEKGLSVVSEHPLYYKNSIIHRSIDNFMIQGGGLSFNIVVLLSLSLPQTSRNTTAPEGNPSMEATSLTKIFLDPSTRKGVSQTSFVEYIYSLA